MEPFALFEEIVAEYVQKEGVSAGKMMSSPALQFRGKVFAFYYKDAMTFKLGKKFDPDSHGLQHWSFLNPFKNKPPMRAWIVVEAPDQDQWPFLTELALAFITQT